MRGPADGRFFSLCASAYSIDDPFQHAHILTETWPEKLTAVILAEPIHMKDARSHGKSALHLDPVTEIIAHVVAAKWKHGHRIAADLSSSARCSRGCFRSHGSAHVNSCAPIECLVD